MSLQSFFNPQSVAIVGASRQKGKVGYEILINMLGAGYAGRIFPVNRSADTKQVRACFPLCDRRVVFSIGDAVAICSSHDLFDYQRQVAYVRQVRRRSGAALPQQ